MNIYEIFNRNSNITSFYAIILFSFFSEYDKNLEHLSSYDKQIKKHKKLNKSRRLN